MKMRFSPLYTFLLSAFALLLSCKPQVPRQYIQPDEFEDILYDYHLAEGIANSEDAGGEDAYNALLYRQAVLKKYGITQAEFDSSLVYYMRHADRLHKIYENLASRLSNDAMALGASANDISRYGDLSSKRDTSNLWTGVSSSVLMPYAPYNVMSFDIEADSSYHKGDRIIFSFSCDFIFRDGVRNATALLAVQFGNDSIASSYIRLSSNTGYSVSVEDNARLGIKMIRGFVYMDKNSFEQREGTYNLNLMFVHDIRLVRMRSASEAPVPPVGVPKDSVKNDSLPSQRRSSSGSNASVRQPLPSEVPVRRQAPARALRIDESAPHRQGNQPRR